MRFPLIFPAVLLAIFVVTGSTAHAMGNEETPDETAGNSPVLVHAPIFRNTECRDVCVEIVLDPVNDYPFHRRYLESVGRRIILNVVYPWKTIQKGAEGEVEIRGKLDRKGTLISLEIFRGSGKPLLDNAASNSISASAPFNPFPPSPFVQSLEFKARFRYFQ